MNIRSGIELENESIVANDKIDKNPAYVKKTMTVKPSEYQNVRNNCYFVSKNKTATREAIRKSRIVKGNLDKFNDKKKPEKSVRKPQKCLEVSKN